MKRSRIGRQVLSRAALVAGLLAACGICGQDKPAGAPKDNAAPAPVVPGPPAGAPQAVPGQAAPAAQPAKPTLPSGVIARVNGKDISLEEYVGYLFASLGKSRLDEFIDRLLLEEEGKRLGISIVQDDVEKAVEERIDRTIKGLYQGNKDAFIEGLAKSRTSLDERKSRLRQELYYEKLSTEIILKARTVTPADITQQFERSYGEGGVQYTIRQILVAARPVAAPTGKPVPEGDAASTRTPTEGRARAEKILKELQSGADFVQAVKQYSDDTLTKKNDGRIPLYRKGFYGEAFHTAVTQLTPENPLSGVVESPRGFHIIQLIEKNVTKLDDVKPEIEKLVKTQVPTAKERHELTQSLRARAKIEGL
jgi:parvulin-like peptidyl-prolyl isomerase